MSALTGFITEYLARLRGVYFLKQYLVIIALFIFGAILTDAVSKKSLSGVKRCALALPVGVCAFSVTGYAMLVTGIPYNKWTVVIFMAAEALAAFVVMRKSFSAPSGVRRMVIAGAVVLAAAALATSGLAPVSISNDTMYYFNRYPDAIVHFGHLRDQFDVFMTDTGLGAVCIDTLPALFGFGETFGLRESFHISFIVFFGACVYERAKLRLSGKHAVIASVVVTAALVISTPFVILGHWALANMYFMELFFIAAYTLIDAEDDKIGVGPVLLLGLAFLRIEGTLFVLWLMLCVSVYRDIARKLAVFVTVPMALLFGGYCFRLFVSFYLLDNIYVFLTPQKALLLIAAICAAGLYLLFIYPYVRKRFVRYMPYVYLIALAAGNILMFIRKPDLYVTNLTMFGQNLFRQSGWGVFPHFVIAMTVLLVIEYVLMYVRKKETADTLCPFDITLTAGFILMVLAVSYGRGDSLTAYVGDSGNRVLLQVVPLIVMTYAGLFIGLIGEEQ